MGIESNDGFDGYRMPAQHGWAPSYSDDLAEEASRIYAAYSQAYAEKPYDQETARLQAELSDIQTRQAYLAFGWSTARHENQPDDAGTPFDAIKAAATLAGAYLRGIRGL